MARKEFKAGERAQMMLSKETISGIIMTGGHYLIFNSLIPRPHPQDRFHKLMYWSTCDHVMVHKKMPQCPHTLCVPY